MIEFCYKWPDGRIEVRYRRPQGTPEAVGMIAEIMLLQFQAKERGEESPYFYRNQPTTREQ